MSSADNWQAVTLAHVLMGYEATVLALVTKYFGGSSYTQSLIIVAFVLYTVSVILLVLTRFASLPLDIVVAAVVIAFMIVAAIFIATGVFLSSTSCQENPYAASLHISSALLAVAVAIFVTISLNAGKDARRTTTS